MENRRAGSRPDLALPSSYARILRTGRSRRGRPPGALKAIVQQMLVEGASPEEVLATARQRGILGLNRRTVERWAARDGSLHERLVRRQVKTAEQLQRSLADGRPSQVARLAEAALFAGLAPSAQSGPGLRLRGLAGIGSALREELESENERLERQAQRLAARQQSITRRLRQARVRVDRVRWELVRRRLAWLGRAIERRSRRGALGQPLLETLRSLCRLAVDGGRQTQGSKKWAATGRRKRAQRLQWRAGLSRRTA